MNFQNKETGIVNVQNMHKKKLTVPKTKGSLRNTESKEPLNKRHTVKGEQRETQMLFQQK